MNSKHCVRTFLNSIIIADLCFKVFYALYIKIPLCFILLIHFFYYLLEKLQLNILRFSVCLHQPESTLENILHYASDKCIMILLCLQFVSQCYTYNKAFRQSNILSKAIFNLAVWGQQLPVNLNSRTDRELIFGTYNSRITTKWQFLQDNYLIYKTGGSTPHFT